MSPQNAPFLVLSFAIHTWLHLYDRPFVQGTYVFRLKVHFFKHGTGFINKLRDDLSVIDLITGAKVIRFTGGRDSLVMEADQELTKFSNVENFNSQNRLPNNSI